MESLRIALASDWFYPKVGGIEAHMDELARNLLKAGHEPYVITHDYRYMQPYDGGFPYPIKRFPATFYIRRYHISLSPTQLIRINEFYKSVTFDITHIHSIYSPLAIAVANVSRGVRDIPVVATNHSFFGNPPMASFFRWELRRSLKRVDHFIAVSTPVARDTAELIGDLRKERPITVIPNGIDTETWRPPEEEERMRAREKLGVGDEIVLFYVGRMTGRKMAHRLPFVIKRALELAGMEKDRVRFVAVGEGDKRPEFEENLRKTGIGEITSLFGFLPRKRLKEFYWASDIVLMPGILEAFPVVGLEAMASGRPIVGRRESGLSDMVIDGLTGYLARSEEELAERLALLLEDYELVEKMGIAGRERAERCFSWENILKRILRVYKNTLDRAEEFDRKYLLYRLSRELG
ncbi:glycosyltransferase family 4 protein [Thermococcus sp.]|uniref:glycosyltransferase family 4 protein n=1 Tax=Thermococcus sp. TaxID=35749 RepID=UPI00260A8DC1|nr:glycosyltransferase family 4 protein [Thermococcus sp.]